MGLLITIEGGEYVGKTTVAVPGLKTILESTGIPVLTSREPGGSAEAEALRKEIFQKAQGNAPTEELAVLFNKSRRIHIEQVIKPFLGEQKEKNAIMILDRYLDSTRVYQGLEGRLPMEKIYELEEEFVDKYFPDITFILYFPEKDVKEFLSVRQKLSENADTATSKREENTWDLDKLAVHEERQKYYFQLEEIAKARGEKRAFYYIDASQEPSKVISEIVNKTVEYLLKNKSLQVDGNFQNSIQKSLANIQKSSFLMFQERQWKKQQQLLNAI